MKKLLILLGFSLFTALSHAQFTPLYQFDLTNGSTPWGGLVSDGTYLYGLTSYGGTTNQGVAFKIKSDGTDFVKLYDFGGAHGGEPMGSLTFDGTYLYGTTKQGGANGGGVIFRIKPDGTNYGVLRDLACPTLGCNSYSTLLYDGSSLYGTSLYGGANNRGVLYKINTDGGSFSALYEFSDAQGSGPQGNLYSDGEYLYGMTSGGGDNFKGVLYKIKKDGTGYTKLIDFDGTNGATPDYNCGLISDGTYLYGSTMNGGSSNYGVVFKIKPDGTNYSKVVDCRDLQNSFCYPSAVVLSDGYLYATSACGSNNNNNGAIFRVRTDGSELKEVHAFDSTNGQPQANNLCVVNGIFYGMTLMGGAADKGIVYSFSPAMVGIEGMEKESSIIQVYPNPTRDQLTIEIKGGTQSPAIITVYNSYGEIVKQLKNTSEKSIVLNRDQLPAGLYIIQYTQHNQATATVKYSLVD